MSTIAGMYMCEVTTTRQLLTKVLIFKGISRKGGPIIIEPIGLIPTFHAYYCLSLLNRTSIVMNFEYHFETHIFPRSPPIEVGEAANLRFRLKPGWSSVFGVA